jgi:hypothetical protein
VLRPSLAAQQYRRHVEEVPVQSLLDPALPQPLGQFDGVMMMTNGNLPFSDSVTITQATTEPGEPCDPRNALRALKTAAKRAGLPSSIGLHTLRHSAASVMLSAGVPLKVVSERHGHASTAITTRTVSQPLMSVPFLPGFPAAETSRSCSGRDPCCGCEHLGSRAWFPDR